jgi:hypothetical protein
MRSEEVTGESRLLAIETMLIELVAVRMSPGRLAEFVAQGEQAKAALSSGVAFHPSSSEELADLQVAIGRLAGMAAKLQF